MTTIKRICFVAAAIAVSALSYDVSGAVPHSDVTTPLLIDGEKLRFEILYGSIPAGHAWLEVTSHDSENGGIYRITSVARSNEFVSLFFKVDDTIISEIDASTFEPRYFEKRLREGPLTKDVRTVYGSDGVVRQGDRTFEVEPGTVDILSALFHVRGKDLRIGDEVTVKTFESGKSYDARIKVLRRERLKTEHGEHDCLVVEPELLEGPFVKTGRVLIWLTDDALRLPVLLKSKVAIGSFVARLVDSSHKGGSS
jgi:hypothetical protein